MTGGSGGGGRRAMAFGFLFSLSCGVSSTHLLSVDSKSA